MRDLTMLSAEKLLSVRQPEALYSRSVQVSKKEYRLLAGRWHPDCEKSPQAQEVFSHVVHMHHLAQQKRDAGIWDEPADKIENEKPGLKRYRLRDGSLKVIAYRSRRRFELGVMYIAETYVAFEVDNEYQDLFVNGRSRIHALQFQDLNMAAEMAPRLPQSLDSFRTGGAGVLVLKKSPDQLLLADVLQHLKGKLPDIRHVGWILNSLYNTVCYLQWAGIAHNAIAPDTIFVSPLRHCTMLLGGWFYAAPTGSALVALPDRTLAVVPSDVVATATAAVRIDLELVRGMGRELLGDAAGNTLRDRDDLPVRLVDWLCQPAGEHSTSDYAEWKYGVLEEVFGEPAFVNWRLESHDLYKEKDSYKET